MVRSIVANRRFEGYLKKCSEEKEFCYGLIVGQPMQKRDFVVHLAKTLNVEDVVEHPVDELSAIPAETDKFSDEDCRALVNHVVSLTRMIPGSFFVLGAFIVSKENIFGKKPLLNKIVGSLKRAKSVLSQNKFFRSKVVKRYVDEMLLLSYASSSNSTVCKSYSDSTNNLSPADWNFVDKQLDWQLVETNYEVDEIFPVIAENEKINLEDNFSIALEIVTSYVENSEIFIQNESIDEDISLESYTKERKNLNEPAEILKCNVYLPLLPWSADPVKIEKFNGSISFSGSVASRIWVHPKSSFKDIFAFVRCDILRSLAARIQVYCDGLTDTLASKDALIINEPPRRVFFEVPDSGGIHFSEYMFRNETPSVVAEQAKEILDLDILQENVLTNFENLPDYDDAISFIAEKSMDNQNRSMEIKKHMYIAGIITALLVLLLSVLLHFIMR